MSLISYKKAAWHLDKSVQSKKQLHPLLLLYYRHGFVYIVCSGGFVFVIVRLFSFNVEVICPSGFSKASLKLHEPVGSIQFKFSKNTRSANYFQIEGEKSYDYFLKQLI